MALEGAPLRHSWPAVPAVGGRALPVPAAILAEARAFARLHPEAVADVEQVDLGDLAWPRTRSFAALLRDTLRRGEGYRWLSLRGRGATPAERRLLFLAIGAAMGTLLTPFGRMYPGQDRSAEDRAAPTARVRERTGFHTDSSVREVLPDFVGLLCERQAVHGGESLVSDALRAGQELARIAPGAWQLLRQDYVRDLVMPGADVTPAALQANRFPVFAPDSEPAGWTLRYQRASLERGQERAGQPLRRQARAALDLLDELLASPEHVVRFRLAAGDMLWINNRTLAHGRADFTDDPARPRLLWRMWVAMPHTAATAASAG